ncbi:MAG: GGDEF domain-containing protein [Butyrivibrio sp.]|nr:GGDEF domain-containing protein [Butyrivibrio sp.]
MVYGNILIFMTFSILHSQKQPYLAATMFLVLVVLVALSYIDNMLVMTLMLLVYSGLFLADTFRCKPSSIATQDSYNTVVFVSLALILHYTFQRSRMHEYVTYLNNIRIQRELEVKSSFDALTSLLNRGRFFAMAGDVLHSVHDEYMAICLLDLDGFKQINDTYGHQMGDKVIQLAGTTILNTMHIDLTEKWSFPERAISDKLSFAGRLGGDEFIVFVRGRKDQAEVLELLRTMLNTLNSVELEGIHGIHASFGVTEISSQDKDIDRAYNRADDALYQSKRAGKNQISIQNNPVGEEAHA